MGNRPPISHATKLKICIHALRYDNMSETARKFGCSVTSVATIKKQFEEDEFVKKELHKARNYDKRVAAKVGVELEKQITKTAENVVESIKESAIEIHELAIRRLRDLIGDEDNLDKVIRAYQATADLIMPGKEADPKSPVNIENVFAQINNKLTNKLAEDA